MLNIDLKKTFFLVSFISIPIFFSIFFDFLLIYKKTDQYKLDINFEPNFSDEFVYKNIEVSKIEKLKKYLSFEDNYPGIKFEELTLSYRKDLSTKFNKNKTDEFETNFIQLDKIVFKDNLSNKKKNFINKILPLAVNENKKIILLRKKIEEIESYLISNKTLNRSDQNFIENLALQYSISIKNKHKIDIIKDLLLSVDIIPNSIVLAQAANESGWGTSRFALEYNAIFGEYTYNDNFGIVPQKREEGRKHLIKYFSSIDKSVESYFKNINTHFAYHKFRKLRNKQRIKNNSINASSLVQELNVYAEDDSYVNTIKAIINSNNFTQFDNIFNISTKS